MVQYDPKAWFQITFSFRGTIVPRVTARLLELGLYTLILTVIYEFLKVEGIKVEPLNPMGHSLMGIAVGMLIVFRNNCSYDRFWEGRRLWGSIVNTSRNLVRGAGVYVHDVADLAGLVSAYAIALKQHLRSKQDLEPIRPLVPEGIYLAAAASANPPNTLAYFLSDWIQRRRGEDRLDAIQARTLEMHVSSLVDCQGGCERILKTPIPFAYACHIKQFLLLYLGTLPFVVIPLMDWLAIPVVLVVTFGLYGIEEVGVEIEDPFGEDPNDLPLDAICEVIGRDAQALANLAKGEGEIVAV